MDFKKTLLFASLIQVSQITAEREALYWKQKIYTLDDLAEQIESQYSFIPSNQAIEIQQLISDAGRDIDSIVKKFEKKTGKKDFYRIAYSLPEDVMFIDIETTGLSSFYHYITMIGWIKNGVYKYWVAGTDPSIFVSECQSAKMIVTFNGVRFDCKFIDKLFPEIKISEKPILDLMYFCKRFKMQDGQKHIEQILGFQRPTNLENCAGKDAIVFWYKFIFGDDDSLAKLIEYNFYDVMGMTYILDRIFFDKIYGKEFPDIFNPSRFYNPSLKLQNTVNNNSMASIRKYIDNKNFDLNTLTFSKIKRIVGIDLAGVIKKTSHTGICLLIDDYATTKAVQTDEEILQFVIDSKADIVSIDAPLSLPRGRLSVYDDDPMRKSAGIMRYSEKILHARGVNSYPALIDSMQELTKRGILLSQKLRKIGYPVIECFPGAAQDILQLPRKRTDVSLLKTGLMRLGIKGDFTSRKVYHDELDAITASIVGKFFIDGYYEPVGIPEENDMIIPSNVRFGNPYKVIVGLAGKISSGKTTAARHIEQKGFKYCRYSQIIAEQLEECGMDISRENMQSIGEQFNELSLQYYLNEQVEKKLAGNSLIVIDGMRHLEDFTYWKEKNYKNFYLMYIDADKGVCKSRYNGDNYDEVVNHHVEHEVESLRIYADIIINNIGSVNDLYLKIDSFLHTIQSNV